MKKYIAGDEKLNLLYEERQRLLEMCIPYKIQDHESGYLNREDVVMGREKLAEIERDIREY